MSDHGDNDPPVQAEGGKKLTRKEAKKLAQRAALDERLAEATKSTIQDAKALDDEDDGPLFDDNFEKAKGSDSHAEDIIVEGFNIHFPTKKIFTGATLKLTKGRRYALVGKNGVGKTTLLKYIARRRDEFARIPSHFDILYVEQEVAASDESALQSVINADTLRLHLLKEEEKYLNEEIEFDPERFEMIQDKLKSIEAYSAEARAAAILHGLQFSQEEMQMPVRTFSGGWRMRIALARALFCRPTVLLLDEPTNHLDLYAVIWLTTYLKQWPNILVVVSHDQHFMNDVCTDIVHCHEQTLNYYVSCTWDEYKKRFNESVAQQRSAYDKLKRAEHAIALKGGTKGGKAAKGAKSAQAQRDAAQRALDQKHQEKKSRAKRGGDSDDDDDDDGKGRLRRPEKDYSVVFQFSEPSKLGPPIIQVYDASFWYKPERKLFQHLEFGIDLDSRIALIGPNGAGKSTLMNLLKGQLEPKTGRVEVNRKLMIGEFTQHFVEKLNPEDTPITHLQQSMRGKLPEEYLTQPALWKHLAKFGLTEKTPTQPVRTLSGGQKSRVVFAELSLSAPHILFLDEPTNHLDVESIEALADALKEFEGGLLLVSHDVRLISDVCDELWVMAGDGTIKVLRDTNFEEYRADLVHEFQDQYEADQRARKILEAKKRDEKNAANASKLARLTELAEKRKAAAAAAASQ